MILKRNLGQQLSLTLRKFGDKVMSANWDVIVSFMFYD